MICSGGLIAQVLPKAANDQSLVNLLEKRCEEVSCFSENLIKYENNLLGLIRDIFPDLDPNPLKNPESQQKIQFKCRCSRKRSISALRILSNVELEQMVKEDGEAELICQFCKNKYIIKKEEIYSLIK